MKKNFNSKKHDQLYIKGFTLVELLATIAILVIISGIIVYVAINVINNAKNKGYEVTISNIENVAMEYAIENQNNISWKYTSIDISEQYYCVNVQDLIDTGYFKSDVLDSYIGKDLLVKSDDYVYLEMNSLTKTITKNKLLLSDDGEYISLCNDASTINSYYFDLNWILDGSNFNSSQVLAGVKIGGLDKGYVSDYYSQVPYGTSWEIYGIKLNGTSIVYSASGIVITENTSHDIKINTLSVSVNSSSYGRVSSDSLYVLENETYTTSNNVLMLGDGRSITATALNVVGHTTTFNSWSSISGTISNATNIVANFDSTIVTYTISYNANGGSGAPSSQTKNWGQTLTLSSKVPTRSGYTFLGWSTSATATGATYSAGGSYTANASAVLYAVWKLSKVIPTFTYTGNYQIVDDSNNVISNITTWNGNWKIRFLTSGTLTFSELNGASSGIDIFVVAGGGNGASGGIYGSPGGGGGGGGASITVTKFPVEANVSYNIIVGSAKSNSSFGKSGTAYYTALAGSTPDRTYLENGIGWRCFQGAGGAGRLSGQTSNYGATKVTVNVGGTGDGRYSAGDVKEGTDGTYEFNGTSGLRYGAGGGAGGKGVSTGYGGSGRSGSSGNNDGGGTGGQGCSFTNGSTQGAYSGGAATANTGSGGGGGGAMCGSGTTSYGSEGVGGAGGSGIVIIRNTR